MISGYQIAFATLGAVIGLASFVPYFRDIFRGTTKPHIFSWAIWTVLIGITFFIQLQSGGGAGSWVTGIEALCCAAVAVFAYTRGEKEITRVDWACFVLALVAIVLWRFAQEPLLATLFVIAADSLGFVPTFRKSFVRPNEETALQYAMSSVHWIFSIAAFQSLVLTTWLYPAWIGTFDAVLVATILMRRRQLNV